MYIIYSNIWSKNQTLYNIKNYINNKDTIIVSITINKYIPYGTDAINNACRRSRVLN